MMFIFVKNVHDVVYYNDLLQQTHIPEVDLWCHISCID